MGAPACIATHIRNHICIKRLARLSDLVAYLSNSRALQMPGNKTSYLDLYVDKSIDKRTLKASKRFRQGSFTADANRCHPTDMLPVASGFESIHLLRCIWSDNKSEEKCMVPSYATSGLLTTLLICFAVRLCQWQQCYLYLDYRGDTTKFDTGEAEI